jgi:hypothetical protein
MSTVDRIFKRYENLADKYANKIWNESNLGLEKEDIKQELKIRLFLAIKSYARRYKEYTNTGGNKPVPIEFYLRTTMINKSRDLIKEINTANFVSSSKINFERGIEKSELEISKYDLVIGGDSILDLFDGKSKSVMKFILSFDFDIDKVKVILKNKPSSLVLVEVCLEKLRDHLTKNKSIVNEYEIYYNE